MTDVRDNILRDSYKVYKEISKVTSWMYTLHSQLDALGFDSFDSDFTRIQDGIGAEVKFKWITENSRK